MIPPGYSFQTNLFVDQCLVLASGNITQGVSTEKVLEKAVRFTYICNDTSISETVANALSRSFDRPLADLKLFARWMRDETTVPDGYHLKGAIPIFHDLFDAVRKNITKDQNMEFIEREAYALLGDDQL